MVEGGPETRRVKAVMGNKAYDFELNALWYSYEVKQSHYIADIILNVPVGSLDLDSEGHYIDYTDHTVTTLESALHNFFLLREAHISHELNQKTPAEAMVALLDLINSRYPWKHLTQIGWQGKNLNDLLHPSRLVFLTQEIWSPTTSGLRLVDDYADTFMNFISLIPLKICHTVWGRTEQLIPENVILLKAETEDDKLLGEMLFDEEYLNMFLKETGHEFVPDQKRVFFFAQEDNRLAEWIIGKTITVKELHEMAVTKGLF